ncbi:uncharacterized protein LOC5667525 [Anopheles gambiae]|uniref:Rho-related GTP-binding protein RhoU n=1 Tax=Anopheles coluzzii TaxID=1518534 RepID=A0A6E8VHP6_ANOCL|nr:uncharacterized protein LOC120949101 [Anopheles coluzzii]XP_049463735.1 uncharacterized protein LOC120949101 [Anopheles coluzzii]XP_049463736.1 uncharacterized protein LOC120949101 [Anopheles coluzzii]XP_061505812.1 uncharacterized protein LOC5667525 [Anopheles gambiae]XP_061505813.1 uncharacterized protein LOC5667525 [Anopheles gambiae]XP_061505814.1 uncharacterized protein LOC5667525 [Anopheles gambiae]XP_061505815.1 uncharacterized protein LOC5667525 [Anopheles gambiae]XP_061505816.1 u
MPPQILPQILGSSGSTSSKMQSRDHPFNRSTRPLLERRAQPQVVSTKKQYQYGAGSTQQPTVPTRGYNDFNLISRQYETWNSNHSHKGYPYGSPPSPTHDFQFSDIEGPQRTQHHQRTVHQYTVNSNNSDDDDDDDYDELVYHHNQLNVASSGTPAGLKVANQQLRRRLLDAASPTPPVPPQRTGVHKTPPPPPSRGRTADPAAPPIAPADLDGPFVFGVHHPNTFTPAYGAKATLYGTGATTLGGKDAKDALHSSPDTSQHSSDTSSCEKSRRALVKEKKNSKRSKIDKKDKSKQKPEKRTSDVPAQPNVKCVLVGDGAVGKTNLILSYIQDRFTHEYVPTAFDKYNVDVSVDGRPIGVTLCDTAGQDALDTLRQLCYPGSDVILLCFSVVQPDSFRSLATKWQPEISKLKGVSVVLVGTQSDLRNDQSTIGKLQAQGEKPILFSSAWDFARKIGAKYIETSSHKKEHIKEVFDTAIWDALQSQEHARRKRPLWKRLCCLTC